MLTLRSPTVTICAQEASCACFMMSIDEYFPVPTISRDENSLPPMTRFVSLMVRPPLTAAHRSDDLDPVAVVQHRGLVGALRRHLAVHGDRRVLAFDSEMRQQRLDADAVGDFDVFSVDAD